MPAANSQLPEKKDWRLETGELGAKNSGGWRLVANLCKLIQNGWPFLLLVLLFL